MVRLRTRSFDFREFYFGSSHDRHDRVNLLPKETRRCPSSASSRTMSNIAFRDSSVVIVETGRTHVRAIFGLHELLRTPAVVSRRLPRLTSSVSSSLAGCKRARRTAKGEAKRSVCRQLG